MPRHATGFTLVVVFMLVMHPLRADAACPPEGKTKATMTALAEAEFAIKDDEERNRLALELVDCLGNADPQWRDGIAYEALATWLRQGRLEKKTLQTLHSRLVAQLAASTTDKAGFRQPFAALVLAALVEADRNKGFLEDGAIAALVDVASDWFESIRDYRGFDARTGWRHAVAHGADLLAQLAVHPATSTEDIDRIVGALATQVAPASGHFYIYGEPERLAVPLIYIAGRHVYTTEQWRDWFAAAAAIPEHGNLFGSQPALARRHNLQALLLALYVNASEGSDAALRATLLPAVVDGLRSLQ